MACGLGRLAANIRCGNITPRCRAAMTDIKPRATIMPNKKTKMTLRSTPESSSKDGRIQTTLSNSISHGKGMLRSKSKLNFASSLCSNPKSMHGGLPQGSSLSGVVGTRSSSSKTKASGVNLDNSDSRPCGTPQNHLKTRCKKLPQTNSSHLVSQSNSKCKRCIEPRNIVKSRYCPTPQDNCRHRSQSRKPKTKEMAIHLNMRDAMIWSPPVRSSTPPQHQSPALPTYRRGTPRHGTGLCYNLKKESMPKLSLDPSEQEICDLSLLDESIILQEKKVELECVQAEKLQLQRRLAKQAQNVKRMKNHCQQSALQPTSTDNMPRKRFKDAYTLKLSEPELDAITLVHTLCNSQQLVKRVTKARATAVLGQAYEPKEPSKVRWHQHLVSDLEDAPKTETVTAKSILHLRSPVFVYPFSDQPTSSVVVVKSTKKSLAYGKEASPLISKVV